VIKISWQDILKRLSSYERATVEEFAFEELFKNRRNIKIPKRRDAKKVRDFSPSRPAIKTDKQIQAEKEKLKQKSERQKQINRYVKNIEYAEKKSNDNLKILKDKLAIYEATIRFVREDLDKLESDSTVDQDKILSLENEINQRSEEAEEFIVYHIVYYFIDVVRWFVIQMEERNKISGAGEQKTEATLRETVGLDDEDEQRIERAFVNTKKALLENYKKYDKYIGILREDKENFDKYKQLKEKLKGE